MWFCVRACVRAFVFLLMCVRAYVCLCVCRVRAGQMDCVVGAEEEKKPAALDEGDIALLKSYVRTVGHVYECVCV